MGLHALAATFMSCQCFVYTIGKNIYTAHIEKGKEIRGEVEGAVLNY